MTSTWRNRGMPRNSWASCRNSANNSRDAGKGELDKNKHASPLCGDAVELRRRPPGSSHSPSTYLMTLAELSKTQPSETTPSNSAGRLSRNARQRLPANGTYYTLRKKNSRRRHKRRQVNTRSPKKIPTNCEMSFWEPTRHSRPHTPRTTKRFARPLQPMSKSMWRWVWPKTNLNGCTNGHRGSRCPTRRRRTSNLDSIVSEAKLAKAVEKKILDAYDKGRLSGISEGRQIDAQAQYNLGLA
jgi:hypothetical protein